VSEEKHKKNWVEQLIAAQWVDTLACCPLGTHFGAGVWFSLLQ
jgi:hypothetical protein